jgi:hypothetical protein
MRARIHHDDAVPVPKQELGMAEIAAAIVGDAMKEQNPVAAWRRGNDFPAAKFDAVTRPHGEVRLARGSSREHLVRLREALRIQVLGVQHPGADGIANESGGDWQ